MHGKRRILLTLLISAVLIAGSAVWITAAAQTPVRIDIVSEVEADEELETIEDEVIPLAGGVNPAIPDLLLYGMPGLVMVMIGCCGLLLYRDRQ